MFICSNVVSVSFFSNTVSLKSFKLCVLITIPGLTTLTLLQGHRFVRNNSKLFVLHTCSLQFKHCMVATYIKKNMHSILWETLAVFKGHKKSSFPLECQSVTALFCSLLTQLVGLVVYQCWNSSIPTCTHLYWIRSFDSLQPSQQIQKCIQHIFLLALKARKHIRKNQVVLELKNQRFQCT